MPIQYLVGNALEPVGAGNKVLVHICNDEGRWGAGFVVALGKKFPLAEQFYRDTAKIQGNKLVLGTTQFVPVRDIEGDKLVVANMIAQRSIGFLTDGSAKGCPPIRYSALLDCVEQVFAHAALLGASVHGPRFGAGLAGGDWRIVELILEATSKKHHVPVTIYDLEAI